MTDCVSDREPISRGKKRASGIQDEVIRSTYQKDNTNDYQSTKKPHKISSEVHKYFKEGNDRIVHRSRHDQPYAKRIKYNRDDNRYSKNSLF